MSTYYCRLCFVKSKPEDSLLFSKYITEITQFCIPEVDMKLVNNPILCTECYDRLEQMLKFKKKCLEVQDNIKKILSNSERTEGVDLNKSLLEKIISSTTCESVASASYEGKENGECQAQKPVNSKNNGTVVRFPIVNSPSSSSSVGPMNSIEDSIDIKTEVDDVTTSSVCNGVDEFLHMSPIECEKRVSKSSSRKHKIVKNVLDVKFTSRYCVPCSLSFNTQAELIHHLYSEHQKDGELYLCLLCRYKSSKLSSIKSHYSNCHRKCSDLNSSCIFCLTHEKNFGDLSKHMKEKHKSICKMTRYICNSCDFRTKSYVNLRKHYFLSHDLICNYCFKYCDDVSALNRHLGNHFSNSKKHSLVEFNQKK